MHGKRRSAGWILAATLAIPGLACQSARTVATGAAPSPEKTTCFNVRDITGFAPLAGRFLYVGVDTDRHYLLTLDRPSDTLRLARNIQISPDYDRVCSGLRAPITYQYEGHVGVYNIVGVEKVQSRDQAETLARERTAASLPPRL